ncbi:aspartate kinase [Thiomicrorhabdus xiamenensis]|uniref:aspartate kinase n=1 Tax=Thiomicrorhabdus xiamenensis TaxID=2739063 RepID=A0A7D4TF18_9GAMM|nr:aspartate kinase [Thiomicrorhabdus xiamenensis]QKI89867.1 aspartate kinase [Thiomicrorhabdus xiamenensis]
MSNQENSQSAPRQLSVEKVGGTSMSAYEAVRDNIVLYPASPYNRVLVVSAYGGVTNLLLEHKKTGQPGVYGLFARGDDSHNWQEALETLRAELLKINSELFSDGEQLKHANAFIDARITDTREVLVHLHEICRHGHFELREHLLTVRELLASIGEAHSAYNLAELLKNQGVNSVFVDLTGWDRKEILPLDEHIETAFADVDFSTTLPIVTGYAHCEENLISTFDRGYSEMTFSRIAVMLKATEAVIHKEFHLSSADPRLVGEENAVPIGKTSYDIADQLANLGMEAIHPGAGKGLRQARIPLRIMNTFEPEHHGTLITADYKSEEPKVEIIAGMDSLIAVEIFDQEMMNEQGNYEAQILKVTNRNKCQVVSKDFNANTITLYINSTLNKVNHATSQLEELFPSAQITTSKLCMVSAMGSNMRVKGLLAKAIQSLADKGINIEAMHQNTRQVEMQIFVDSDCYATAVKALHQKLIEVHDHGMAIASH